MDVKIQTSNLEINQLVKDRINQKLGHGFYRFNNVDAGQYNVICLRDEGDYGLIQPI